MATRSTIAIQNDDTIRMIYCHWDGYPDGVGETLKKHYTDKNKINKLIDLGSLSYLGEKIEAPVESKHSFNNPVPDVTVAYHRDRNEDLDIIEIKTNDLSTAFDKYLNGKNFEQFNYIYKNGEWLTLNEEGHGVFN